MIANLADKRVLVMGLGRFGGGLGVTRWLVQQGARVTVTDLAGAAELQPSVDQLCDLPITLHLGRHDASDLDDTDLLVVNPAVDKSRSAFVQAARERGIPLTSEMHLFLAGCPARLIGVTGTVGKSTTAAMIFDLLYARLGELAGSVRRVWLGGNIGQSLLGDLAEMGPDDWVVLELSSFQLADLPANWGAAQIAVITHLSPHHLERHGDMASYVRAKLAICRGQGSRDALVISESAWTALQEYGLANADAVGGGQRILFGSARDLAGELKVIGAHNLANAAAAREVGRQLGLTDAVIRAELMQFSGLPHRLEFVREYNGVRYYNDSKATSPEATTTALQSFEQKVILLCGGQDGDQSFAGLAEHICEHARMVICFGQARAKIATVIRRLSGRRVLPGIKSVHEFNGAPNLARRLARPGEVVLFSPACPSFDAFANYEARGQQFKDVVNGWVTGSQGHRVTG